jgi:hypothetical protein
MRKALHYCSEQNSSNSVLAVAREKSFEGLAFVRTQPASSKCLVQQVQGALKSATT